MKFFYVILCCSADFVNVTLLISSGARNTSVDLHTVTCVIMS